MLIRRMEQEDIQAVAQIEKQCFSLPWSAKEIEKTFSNSNSIFCVAVDQERIVGYIGLLTVLDEGDIINVAVDNQSRRQGIAKGLLQFLLTQAKKAGVKNITLEVRESNHKARQLYENFGFEIAGMRKNFYEKPAENALIMWKYNI